MSHQQRTWVETTDQASGMPRWDVYINGNPVPGGYILRLANGQFEAHYPHIAPFAKETLVAAKERLEWAPPITSGALRIAREVPDDPRGFIGRDAAAEKLGMSVYRVNAMVANGKLTARRTATGEAEVGASSLAELLET